MARWGASERATRGTSKQCVGREFGRGQCPKKEATGGRSPTARQGDGRAAPPRGAGRPQRPPATCDQCDRRARRPPSRPRRLIVHSACKARAARAGRSGRNVVGRAELSPAAGRRGAPRTPYLSRGTSPAGCQRGSLGLVAPRAPRARAGITRRPDATAQAGPPSGAARLRVSMAIPPRKLLLIEAARRRRDARRSRRVQTEYPLADSAGQIAGHARRHPRRAGHCRVD